MPSQQKNEKNIVLPKQNRYLFIVFLLFPLFLLNIGWYFLNYIESIWQENIRNEQARQEVEALAASSDFSYCFASISGNFFEELQTGINSYPLQSQKLSLSKYIEQRSKYKFREPFPEYELFVFRISEKNESEITYSNVKNFIGKRALILAFEFLAKVNLEDDSYSDTYRKKGSSIFKSIFESECEPNVIAESQRAKTSYITYNHKL